MKRDDSREDRVMRKSIRKAAAVSMAAVMAFAMTGCGGSSADSETTAAAAAEDTAADAAATDAAATTETK